MSDNDKEMNPPVAAGAGAAALGIAAQAAGAATGSADAPPQVEAEGAPGAGAAALASTEAHALPTSEDIREALKEVIDPELGINIVDLGLIYDVLPNDGNGIVDVNMTLTSPGCPAGPEITSAVWMTVKRMPGVKDCEVKLVWSPRWDPQVHASEEARMYLGLW